MASLGSQDLLKIEGLALSMVMISDGRNIHPDSDPPAILGFTFFQNGILFSLTGNWLDPTDQRLYSPEVHDVGKGRNHYVPYWYVPDHITAVFSDGETHEICLLGGCCTEYCDQAGS